MMDFFDFEDPDLMTDVVFLKGVAFETIVDVDAWHRAEKPQPVVLDLQLSPPRGLNGAASDDDVSQTLDYGKLYKRMKGFLEQVGGFANIQDLYLSIVSQLKDLDARLISINLPKAILLADGGVRLVGKRTVKDGGEDAGTQCLSICDINVRCVVGVNPHERLETQRLNLQLDISSVLNEAKLFQFAGVEVGLNFSLTLQQMVKFIVEKVEGSAYETIEALAMGIVQIITMNYGFDNARVTINKPSAIAGITTAGVTIARPRSYFENKDFWKVKRP